MTITYQQIDTNTGVADVAGCSGATQGQQRNRCGLVGGGTAGSTADALTIAASAGGHYLYQMGTLAGDPSFTNWSPGGTATVELNVTTGDSQVGIDAVWLCRIGSNATNKGTLGSTTGIAYGTDGTMPFSTNVTVAATNADGGDKLYVVWVFDNGNMHSAQGIQVTPDEQIVMPWNAPVAATNVDLDGWILSASTTQADLTQLYNLQGRVLSASTSRGGLDQVTPVYNDLTGRTLCHGLTWTSPADFVNREATTRTLSLSTSRATLSQQVDVTGRTTGVTTSRATLSVLSQLTGRTASVTTSRAALSQVAGAVFNDLTGRTLAGRAGYYTTPTFNNLTGRVLCHGLTYSYVAAVDVDLAGRTTSVQTSRALLSQSGSSLDLTGRTLCHGLTYSAPAPVVGVNQDLTGRTLCHGLTYTSAVPPVNVDLTGRTLCHGLTYSFTPAVVGAVNLTGRAACLSYPGGTVPGFVNVDLTGRTLAGRAGHYTVVLPQNLTGRTVCLSYPGGTQEGAVDVDLTGRVLCVSTSTTSGGFSFAPRVVDLTARVLGVAGYWTRGPVDINVYARTQGLSSSRADLSQFQLIDIYGRSLSISSSRADLGRLETMDLSGRILCIGSGRGGQDFLPRLVDIYGRALCLSLGDARGFTFTFPKTPGELRGIILRVDPIGEIGRPITPRGRMGRVTPIGEGAEGIRRGRTAGLLSVGETK